MKQPMAPTLSGHLLREANRFLSYPETVRRTRNNLLAQEMWDKIVEKFAQWRKTFAPRPEDLTAEIFLSPTNLDEYYCRDLLTNVPSVVERTLKLKHVNFLGIASSEFVYLREAANCYIYGLPNAAVALARAAMEECLRKKLAKLFGKDAVADTGLKKLIDELAPRMKVLSSKGRSKAHNVRNAGDDILHSKVKEPPDTLAVIEDARAVILELSRP